MKARRNNSSITWTYAVGCLLLLLAAYASISIFTYDPADHSFFVSMPNDPAANRGGLVGAEIAFRLRFWFGHSAYLLPLLCILWAGCFFAQQIPRERFIKGTGLLLLLAATATLSGLTWRNSDRFEAGGLMGYFLARKLSHYCGLTGSYLIAGFCVLMALVISTDFVLAPWFKSLSAHLLTVLSRAAGGLFISAGKLGSFLKPVWPKGRDEIKRQTAPPDAGRDVESHTQIPLKVKQYQPFTLGLAQKPVKDKHKERESMKEKEKESVISTRTGERPSRDEKDNKPPVPSRDKAEGTGLSTHTAVTGRLRGREDTYGFPPLGLLESASDRRTAPQNLKENSRILQNTLRDFGIDVRVTEIEEGPVITRYELLPAPGVKVQSILTRENDLALALKAKSVRIIAPIPGKGAVGIEVPNAEAHTVCLKDLVISGQSRLKRPRLPILLGKDTSGQPMIADLTDMPHLLVAGTTGSGKTVFLNAAIAGFLYFLSPDDLKFIMIDPKMVELTTYNSLPHMISPVVTDSKKAAATLNWLVSEMETRYKLLAQKGVRNIHAFNARRERTSEPSRDETDSSKESATVFDHMPYIVVIIDELADLMLVAQDKVEAAISRLAQLSRAVGIHLILATQRPSVDVITGVIKANFPARLSFKVASKIDSRTVLDANGADQLLGRGDMLFLEPGEPEPRRGQVAWVGDAEIARIVEFYKNKATPQYVSSIQEAQQSTQWSHQAGGEKDELFDAAVKIVIETGVASTSHLQRRLRLGYSRAARLLDSMEAEGIVGPPNGSKPREIFRKIDTPNTPQ